jgi:error-prone DNA polymerase
MTEPFVHLSVRSAFSLKEGAILPQALPHVARQAGMGAVAITDRDSLAGAVRFTKACAEASVQPIYGVRMTTARDEIAAASGERFTVTVLAQDERGYGDMCRLVSAAHARGERGDPCVTLADIAEASQRCFVLLGRDSDVGRLLAQNRRDEALAGLRAHLEGVGFPRLRLAVSHLLRDGDDALAARTLALSDETGVRAVATNDVRTATRADAFLCDVLDAIRKLVPLAEHHREDPTREATLKSPAEMARVFAERPDLLTESVEIAAACGFTLPLGRVLVPPYPIAGRPLPKTVLNSMLARRCHEGLARRGVAVKGRVKDILDRELAMCARLGWSAYFLAVADLVQTIREMGVRCACRGSAAGSLICYALAISEVDPIEQDLVFERFMNEHRTHELPDIDVDVESARREDCYRALISRFPQGQAGCLAMYDTFQARGAIREVGKALGLPEAELGIIAKAFPHIRASGINRALERLPELAQARVDGDRLAMLFDVCTRLDGFPRHLALHPSGVLISPLDLSGLTPIERSAQGFPMAQLDKHDVADLGLLKLDVLGVRMLSAMTHTAREVERVTGEHIDLDGIEREDPATFELIRASRTLGCFQIESPGQRELLQKLQPERWKDLIIEISLFRPGPVRSDMVTPYLMRRAGLQRAFYAHPELRRALGESHGIIVYHEQVMRSISAVTGVDLGFADKVRRALEDEDALPKIEAWFTQKGRERGWRDEEISAVWREVASFAAFGFCKAHAAAFAVPTYQSAYLKTHHPAAFFAGILTHEPGMYPRRALLDDARQEGVLILPLDIRISHRHYTLERTEDGEGVRIGLMHVEQISDEEITSILEARAQRVFDGLVDFARRTRVKRPVVEALIHAGAFDAFAGRRDLLLAVGELWGRSMPRPEPSQGELMRSEPVVNWGLREYNDAEKVRAELEVLGMDASRHLMSFYAPVLQAVRATHAKDLRNCKSGERVMVAGVKVASQTPQIRSGQRIIFLTLDDGFGLVDVTVFESVQEHCAYPAFHSWLQLVRGTVHRVGRAGLSINAERIHDLSVVSKQMADRSLDVEALWIEGVAEIEENERQRRLVSRQKRQELRADLASRGERAPRPVLRLPRNGPAGAPPAQAPRKLWHRSAGSAG